MKPRYVLWPQWITSKSDGDRHYISFGQLIDLYHLDWKTDYMCSGDDPGFRQEPDLDINCHVKFNGDYPKEKPTRELDP